MRFFSYLCNLAIFMAKYFRRYNSTIYGNYRKAYLLYGLMTGVVMSLTVTLWNAFADKPLAEPENLATEAVLLICTIFATYQYRHTLPDGRVTLKELMLLGLGVGVVSAIIYGLWTWFYCGVWQTELVQHYIESRIAAMQQSSNGTTEQNIALVRAYTAGDWALIGAIRTAVMSIIITFFSALVFRTEKSPVRERKSTKETK